MVLATATSKSNGSQDLSPGNAYPPTMSGAMVHSALLTSAAIPSTACPDSNTYDAATTVTSFDIACSTGRSGSENLTSIHELNVTACMDAYAEQRTQGCKAILFNMFITEGYDNCYLLNATSAKGSSINIVAFIIDREAIPFLIPIGESSIPKQEQEGNAS